MLYVDLNVAFTLYSTSQTPSSRETYLPQLDRLLTSQHHILDLASICARSTRLMILFEAVLGKLATTTTCHNHPLSMA